MNNSTCPSNNIMFDVTTITTRNNEQSHRVISPLPFTEDNDESTMGADWAMDDDFESTDQALVDSDPKNLYSFYFESSPNLDVDCSPDDDLSLTSHEDESSCTEDVELEYISEDPASFWEKSIEPFHCERRLSPAEITIEGVEQLHHLDTIHICI